MTIEIKAAEQHFPVTWPIKLYNIIVLENLSNGYFNSLW